ncbi:hypothetical protein CCAL6883_08410 [Campylobacter sp. RM6883]|nr:hypothetical protein [Campylobacter sp. RM6914]MBE2985358.1 hypothetical protein [Campylobacter sp. RM6883]MBE2995891.1 hypothetical protein [Campylobacter sp. RM6913]
MNESGFITALKNAEKLSKIDLLKIFKEISKKLISSKETIKNSGLQKDK